MRSIAVGCLFGVAFLNRELLAAWRKLAHSALASRITSVCRLALRRRSRPKRRRIAGGRGGGGALSWLVFPIDDPEDRVTVEFDGIEASDKGAINDKGSGSDGSVCLGRRLVGMLFTLFA